MGAKGRPKTGGRTRGTPNKITNQMREMVLQAVQLEGGVDYLRVQAREHPNIFGTMLAKCIPQAVELNDGLDGLPMVTFNFAGRPIDGDGKRAGGDREEDPSEQD